MTSDYRAWTERDAAECVAVPRVSDDKYSRGVLGVITGSNQYPGAAVLGVESALHTGVGMVRYLGPARPTDLVLARCPEVVTSNGRVQAWLIGSGMDATAEKESEKEIREAIDQRLPVVLDAGALDLVRLANGPVVITPHYSELARIVDTEPSEIAHDPGGAAARAANELGVTVLLKGHTTYIAAPDGSRLSAAVAPTWLATAGTGDALGGILGALVATHAEEIARDSGLLARLAATASVLHGLAATRASRGGPLRVLDLAREVSPVIATLLGT